MSGTFIGPDQADGVAIITRYKEPSLKWVDDVIPETWDLYIFQMCDGDLDSTGCEPCTMMPETHPYNVFHYKNKGRCQSQ